MVFSIRRTKRLPILTTSHRCLSLPTRELTSVSDAHLRLDGHCSNCTRIHKSFPCGTPIVPAAVSKSQPNMHCCVSHDVMYTALEQAGLPVHYLQTNENDFRGEGTRGVQEILVRPAHGHQQCIVAVCPAPEWVTLPPPISRGSSTHRWQRKGLLATRRPRHHCIKYRRVAVGVLKRPRKG